MMEIFMKTLRRIAAVAAIALSVPLPTHAATEVAPIALNTNNLSGTIAVTNTFQSIQIATTRSGCTVQNPTTNVNTQWVYFGPIASATIAKAVQLLPGGSVSCAVGGTGALKDQISIVGTSGDTFYAGIQ